MLFRSIQKKIKITSDLIEKYGLNKFIIKIIPWLFHKKFFIYAGPTEGAIPDLETEIPFRLELAKEEDISLIVRLHPTFYTPNQIKERLRNDHLCFLGWTGNELIHIRWIFVRSCYLPYLHKTIDLKPEEVFSDEAYTAPDFRLKGVYSHSEDLMRKILDDMGYKRIIRAIPTWDSSLQETAEKKRMKKIGDGGYLNIFGIRRFYWRGAIQELDRKTIALTS
jgi:hypothetical protein